MAKRRSTIRVNSEAVQGEGSYVVIRRLTVAEMLDMSEAIEADRQEPNSTERLRQSLMRLADHVVEWDWVDDDGDPLPIPKDDPIVLGELLDHEVAFLGNALAGGKQEVELKN